VPRNPVDVFVGGRVKMRRTFIGMSQEKLGLAVGLTFQQIQKYEKGANRIGASRLYQFAHILGVPPAFFFDGIDVDPGLHPVPGFADPAPAPLHPTEPVMTRENIELLKAFGSIKNPALRRRVLDLVRSMAMENPADSEA